jgi:hypothetical protein
VEQGALGLNMAYTPKIPANMPFIIYMMRRDDNQIQWKSFKEDILWGKHGDDALECSHFKTAPFLNSF